jgi:hypothetical protein
MSIKVMMYAVVIVAALIACGIFGWIGGAVVALGGIGLVIFQLRKVEASHD